MTAIAAITETAILVPSRGRAIRGYLAFPSNERRVPGVLVHPTVAGTTSQLRGVSRRLAEHGYAALSYDLYSRFPEAPQSAGGQALLPFYKRIADDAAATDMAATMNYFRALSAVDEDRIGVLGFCTGFPIVYACHDLRLRACVAFYSRLRYDPKINHDATVSPLDRIPGIWSPFLGHFGDTDTNIPITQVRDLEATLKRFGKTFQVHVYPEAGHGFFDETGNGYREEAASLAWTRTLAFLAEHLG